MFLLMWVKIITYLSVFKSTRYLIKMIMEIIADISTFLIILGIAMMAYAQIMWSLDQLDVSDEVVRNSYVLAFGELGDFQDFGTVKFFIFVLFTFFIPLLLMNMLIAIMSDAYERVQANSAAADVRSLADMELEYEEVVHFF
jgi:ABC-type multidrug transport system fused ATPase/permease subunit